MPWHARLQLDYRLEAARTVARFSHDGPLRILQSMHPEGDAVCHNVLVHPPGGLVGGDTLDISVTAASGSHGLITTPGATRFYRSDGEPAVQRSHISVAAGARVEWLPLEAICYDACLAENHLAMQLEAGAEMIGWDLCALGLPHASLPFERGSYLQHIEVPGVWQERGLIEAGDHRLMNSPLGLAGHRCMASIFFIAGTPLARARRQGILDAARAVIDTHPLQATAGATSPQEQLVVVRVLAPVVEPAMALLREIWVAWRSQCWDMLAPPPRIWST
ncbi:MAG: urease accessory protein UreD [Burkholderiaceae bacterium]|nr:urease accessory protein UreD [Burkholderiaceae bacterium]MDO9090134.1 urease accessory protein UreD [Burkholderiaceae bacterium]